MDTKRFISLVVGALIAFSIFANQKLDLPIKTIGNTEYYYYQVQKKDNIYSIAKTLGVTKDYIEKYNPSTKEGLSAGQVLLLPVSDKKESSTPTASASKPQAKAAANVTHVVAKGETVYGISKLYGIGQEELVAANNGISAGLKVGDTIVIPQSTATLSGNQKTDAKPAGTQASKPASEAPSKLIYHRISSGETLYSIAQKYVTSIEEITNLNPGISPQSLHIGDVIKVHSNTLKSINVELSHMAFEAYQMKAGDTYESIAAERGINESELQDANPLIKKPRKGTIINIPVMAKETVTISPEEQIKQEADNASKVKSTVSATDTVRLAVILPFMLQAQNPSRQDLLYTEFFKGFLFAADSIKHSIKNPVKIYAFDNEGSDSRTSEILKRPVLSTMTAIIAPPSDSQLSIVNRFGSQHNIAVLNAFSVKNEDYNENNKVLQLNIPPTYLTAEVISRFDQLFGKHHIIALESQSTSHKDIYDDLIAHLTKAKRNIININVGNDFSAESLTDALVPGEKYVVLPANGTRDYLQRIIPALRRVKSERTDIDLSLFGYPEYVALMPDFKESFTFIDTYIYSRFFFDQDKSKTIRFEASYKNMYGEEMRYTVPKMGMLGFDCAMMLMLTLDKNAEISGRSLPSYQGIQTNFQFERISNWSGFINKSVKFIHLSPNGTTTEE